MCRRRPKLTTPVQTVEERMAKLGYGAPMRYAYLAGVRAAARGRDATPPVYGRRGDPLRLAWRTGYQDLKRGRVRLEAH